VEQEKVLMFGQSAGAINTFIIATLPQAPSLMNAAITESGGGRDVELNSSAQSLGASYAAALGCSDVSEYSKFP
jgi:carboxylesterase type B